MARWLDTPFGVACNCQSEAFDTQHLEAAIGDVKYKADNNDLSRLIVISLSLSGVSFRETLSKSENKNARANSN